MMDDDDISFFMMCSQILPLDSAIYPYLYRCRIFSSDHQFGLVDHNMIHQILTDQIYELFLVVGYSEDDLLCGQSCAAS